MYTFTKIKMPVDVQFFYNDTKELLRPFMVLPHTYQATVEILNALIQEEMAAEGMNKDANSDLDHLDVQERNKELQEPIETEEQNEVEESKMPNEGEIEETDDLDDLSQDSDVDAKAEEELEREFQRMMHESKNERKVANFDAPLPAKQKVNAVSDGSNVPFMLLSKKGSKQQASAISLPKDSSFAILALKKQRQDEEERAILKKIVLSLEELDHSEGRQQNRSNYQDF
jgi:regulator of nonsense transcripts 2